MILLLAIVTAGVIPQPLIASESVAMVEVNHFYDPDGKHVLDQVIFWDWSNEESTHRVIDWRLCKCRWQHPHELNGRWVCTWFDGGTLRRVEAAQYRETWTQVDPEVRDRKFLRQEDRRKLINLRKAK